MEYSFLNEITIIIALSIGVLLLCHQLRLPMIVGFLVTGMLAGPHGLALIHNLRDVQTMAEIGIVLLLFSVGMELSVKDIFSNGRYFILGGSLQVVLTICAGYLVGVFGGFSPSVAVFLGCLLAMSSTAIVLHIFEEHAQVDSPQGKLVMGVLIFQDLIAVVIMLAIPWLGAETHSEKTDWISLTSGFVILVVAVGSAYSIIPHVFYYVARTKSRELFLLSILAVCFLTAWLAASVGLSLSLGAFLAGLMVSDTDYKHEAVGDILPFQELFTSFFFVSIGMLFDTHFVIEQPLLVFSLTALAMVIKGVIVGVVTLIVGFPLRIAALAAMALSQIGEFSFVLAREGLSYGLGSAYSYQLFLAVAIISMALTPFCMHLAPYIARLCLRFPWPERFRSGLNEQIEAPPALQRGHMIIVGYGLSGRNLALAAGEGNIPYVVLEMNPATVRNEKKRGVPIFFGDASQESVLRYVHVAEAKIVAVLINDPAACRRIVEVVRRANSAVYIIVRTRYLQDMKPLFKLGADEVVPDEFGASIEVFIRALRRYEVNEGLVDRLVDFLRSGTLGGDVSQMLYRDSMPSGSLRHSLSTITLESLRLSKNAPLVGKTLRESALRQEFHLNIMLIKRGDQVFSSPHPEEQLHAGDVVVVVGCPEQLKKALHLFKGHLTAVET